MTTITFQPLFPAGWVILLACMVMLLLGWLEFSRKQQFVIPRLLALFIAVASIACLILKPGWETRRSANFILLTKNFNHAVCDSLINAIPGSEVYQLAGAGAGNSVNKLADYRELENLKGNIFVLGEGVPLYALHYLDTGAVKFFPAVLPAGFSAIKTSSTSTAGQPAVLEGIIQAPGVSLVKLEGPGATEDSVNVTAEASQHFSLTFVPKAAGNYVYTLTAADAGGRPLYSEPVPVTVAEPRTLAVLIIADYPSAEIRFLKNFLETQGHQLTLRYRMSKDKYRTEFVNTKSRSIGRLTVPLLSDFDLLITDVPGLASMNGTETRALQESLKAGLGLLTLLNTSDIPEPVSDFLSLSVKPVKSDSAQLSFNKKPIRVAAIPVEVSSRKKIFAIQQETTGRIISGYHTQGSGKYGFQLLNQTYSLGLAGEKELYAYLWWNVISKLARKEIKKYELNFVTPFPYYKNEPVAFKIISSSGKPVVRMDSTVVPLAEDPLIKNVWHGKIWAGPTGWETLYIEQDSSEHTFYVSDADAWEVLRVVNQQVTLNRLVSSGSNSFLRQTQQPISQVFFFTLFIISAAFLWLAPKL